MSKDAQCDISVSHVEREKRGWGRRKFAATNADEAFFLTVETTNGTTTERGGHDDAQTVLFLVEKERSF